MSIVTGPLDIRDLAGKDWRLLAPLEVFWRDHEFTVPKGFVTDLASIPRIARTIVPKGGDECRGAVVHDFIYRGHQPGFTRSQADALFLAVMKEDGVGWLRRRALYLGVRAGGWASWKGQEDPSNVTLPDPGV